MFGIVVNGNQPAQAINPQTNDDATSYVYWGGSILACCQPPAPHWATISCVALSTSASFGASDRLYVVGIVVKVNQPGEAINPITNDDATSYVY
jgi:hypothetical protein